MKNVLCVHGTIEIALEQIQCDIAANLRRQKCLRICTMCVMSLKYIQLEAGEYCIETLCLFILENAYTDILCLIDKTYHQRQLIM